MAVKVLSSSGKKVTLLNPSEKGAKYAKELRTGKAYTNDGKLKVDSKGKAIKLTAAQKARRSGYLAAQSNSAKCYNATHCAWKIERCGVNLQVKKIKKWE